MASIDLGMVTAYAYAVAGGYTGSEQDFEDLLGNIAIDLEEIENLSVTVTTLPEGSQATASYNNGVLSLGIPKGDTGATGAEGPEGPTGPTGNGISGIEKTGTSGNVDTYTILYTNGQTTTFTVTNGAVTSVDGQTGDVDLSNKANIDGYYEDLTAGYAENLISNVYDEENVPYNFRTAGGSLDIGSFEYDEVVGGTVAVNQLINIVDSSGSGNGLTWTFSGGVLTVNGTATADTVIQLNTGYAVNITPNHKYAVVWTGGGSSTTYQLVNGTTGGAFNNSSIMAGGSSAYGTNIRIKVFNGTALSNKKFTAYITDITQLFGTTIADYIYTLETGNAGAGVAWFKKLFPKSYYPYNVGELMHVQTSGHKMVGFNAYNPTAGTAKLVGGMEYEISGTYSSVSYTDISGNAETLSIVGGKFTPTNNGTLTVTSGNATNTCVHLVWDGERDGEYEAYKEYYYPLDSTLVLRGKPYLDSANRLKYDGDIYNPNGTVTRKYGVVDLGTVNWTKNWSSGDPTYIFYTDVISDSKASGQFISQKYVLTTGSPNAMTNGQGTLFTNNRLYVCDTSTTDANTLKTSLNGVYLVYELATPTTETADTFQNPQAVSNWGTEEYIDTRSIPIPVGHNTKYPPDLKAKLETSPNPPDADGDYIVRQTNGVNEYVALSTNATIQNIISRLEALEG